MAYSPQLRHAIGAMTSALAAHGLDRQDPRFARHGIHEPAADAPLVLVACSGGRDSIACAALAATVCGMLGMRAGAAIVDHHLQESSGQAARAAAETCTRLGLDPVVVADAHVETDHRGLEAAARDARYAALVDVAHREAAAAVLLAHTLDDQAETVLIDLMRAAGTDALAGMPASQRVGGILFIRPLLDVSRSETTAICSQLALPYWDDPTNGDDVDPGTPLGPQYPLRSRVRHDLLPALDRFAGCDMARRLADGARIARRDVDALDAQADRVQAQCVTFDGRDARIDARLLAEEPEAIRMRVIAHVLARCAPGSSSRHAAAVDALVSSWHGQGPVQLPGKRSANRQKHVIEVCEDVTHANRRRARQD